MTFDYKRYMRIGGPIFGAASIVVTFNFILTKGLKKSPLHDHPMVLLHQRTRPAHLRGPVRAVAAVLHRTGT